MLQVGCQHGPGGKNDPGLTIEESRTHFGSWAVVSSPLTLSHDVNNKTVTDAIWDIISNTEVIAVNQAYAGFSGGSFSSSSEHVTLTDAYIESNNEERVRAPSTQYLYKPLGGGKMAVVLLNSGDSSADLEFKFSDIPGISGSQFNIRDCEWSRCWFPREYRINYSCLINRRGCSVGTQGPGKRDRLVHCQSRRLARLRLPHAHSVSECRSSAMTNTSHSWPRQKCGLLVDKVLEAALPNFGVLYWSLGAESSVAFGSMGIEQKAVLKTGECEDCRMNVKTGNSLIFFSEMSCTRVRLWLQKPVSRVVYSSLSQRRALHSKRPQSLTATMGRCESESG